MSTDLSQLSQYGILEEQSDIRAHVAPGTGFVFIFKTHAILEQLKRTTYRTAPAYQPGVSVATAKGHVVPWIEIPDIVPLVVDKATWQRYDIKKDESTSVKGTKARDLIQEMLRDGRFPLFAEGIITKDVKLDISGTDILIEGRWRIQTKCDYDAGPGGTGNLFIQTHESNPLKKY